MLIRAGPVSAHVLRFVPDAFSPAIHFEDFAELLRNVLAFSGLRNLVESCLNAKLRVVVNLATAARLGAEVQVFDFSAVQLGFPRVCAEIKLSIVGATRSAIRNWHADGVGKHRALRFNVFSLLASAACCILGVLGGGAGHSLVRERPPL